MHRPPPLGCLSPLAIFSAALTLLVLVVLALTSGYTMFSPGALNAQAGLPLGGASSHADIKAALPGSDCAACHAAFWSGETMSDRCLVCHTAVRDEMNDPSRLHGFLAEGAFAQPIAVGQAVMPCQECHSEHHGPDAALTSMKMADFPHHATGFSLDAHQFRAPLLPFTCADCHGDSVARFNLNTCTDCHRELDAAFTNSHLLDFGDDCLACHDGIDRFADFDHAQAGDPLTGRHAGLECRDCHTNARSLAGLQASSDCASCHLADDAHEGKFGADCQACHQPTTWQDASFDHSLSDFHLDGAHVDVACEECHRDATYHGTPFECSACHADPPFHAGLFPNQPCQDCHTTTAWRPARFTGEHRFPMDHGEQNNTCADCHQPNLTQWTCDTCHKPAEVEREHRDEGIANLFDCLECHPTGKEDD